MVALPDMATRLAQCVVSPDLPIAEALARLQEAGTGMLILAREDGRLFGVITDGDIRRHILAGESLERRCSEIAVREPLVAPADVTPQGVLTLMDHGREFVVNHLPVVGPDREVLALWLRSDLATSEPPAVSAVIMAGGYGRRLYPLTDSTPKPMLPVGDRPLLEHTIERLRAAGIRHIKLTTHYLSERISDHFGDGHAFGVDVTYVNEDQPLGTAGSLRLFPPTDEPLLVINGDVLTGVDYQSLLQYHREHKAQITVGVRKYELQVPFGVLECAGARVQTLREKPVQRFLVNAGLYLLEPTVLDFIPRDRRFDMTDLIQQVLAAGQVVVSFPIVEYWLDVGRPADYERAQSDVKHGLVGG